MKRYRHTKMIAANPNSKNSQRKAMRLEKEAKEARRNGTSTSSSPDKQSGANSSSGSNKNDMVKIKKGGKTKLVKHMTVGKYGGKSELKGSMQIAKERRLKEKRREKTGRHFKSGGKK
jgi:ATP-dependent RNA helicase DDX54/DBP10